MLLVGCGPKPGIWKAAKSGNAEAVQHLANGVDVNGKGWGDWTALHYAVDEGHKEIIELLLTSGSDVNAKRNDGSTALHYAALSGRKQIAELIIDKGANVNEKDVNGKTPLDNAVV